MKLVQNWKRISYKAHSQRAVLLGFLSLNMADILYLALGFDPLAPAFWTILGNLLFVYGFFGRIIAQGIDE